MASISGERKIHRRGEGGRERKKIMEERKELMIFVKDKIKNIRISNNGNILNKNIFGDWWDE
jgi:hypothetical protein